MYHQIRAGTFETASSAIHSLVISDSGMEKSKMRLNKDGMISVQLTYLGPERELYSTQKDKLVFLLTLMFCQKNWQTMEDVENDYDFQELRDAVCEYSGAKGIKITNLHSRDIGCDHQIYNDICYGDLPYVNLWVPESVQQFVFNKYIAVQTDRD